METKTEEKPEVKPVEINLNALASPEGTAPENFEQFVSKEAETAQSSSKLYNLPNLDPTPESKDAPADINNEETAVKDDEVKVPGNAADTAGKDNLSLSKEWYIKPFKDLQKKLGLTDEEFKLPEGLTEENYLDKYNEFLYENTEFEGNENIHPELKKINDLISKGVDFNEAVGAYQRMNSLEKLSDKELVALSLKQQFGKTEERKDGWEQDKIDERIAKMDNSGYLEIEAARLRNLIKAEKENINSRYEESIRQQTEKRNAELETKRNTEIENTLKVIEGMKDIYGIPVSKAELQEFREDFKYLVTPGKDGKLPINEILQSNEELAKMIFFLRKGNSKVRDALTTAKESAKKSVIDKLDDEPRLPKKTAPYVNEAAINLDALSREAKD